MTALKKIFISHSSKTDANREILEQVCKALPNDFTVLVDNRIEPSSEWFPCLNEYMMECHAAIILLSTAALESDWVKAEAAVLCSRKRCEKDFKLFWIPLDSMNPEDINKDNYFKTIRLSDIQSIRDFDNTDEMVIKLLNHLQILSLEPPTTPFDELVILIRDVLKKLNAENDTLESIWQSLKDEAKSTKDHADAIARLLLREPEHIFIRLRTLIEKLAHILSKQQAETLIKIIQGQWVNPAAASLLNIARTDNHPVAINGIEIANFTGDCYARKAWPYPQEYTLIPAGKDYSLKGIKETLEGTLGKSAVSQSRKEERVKNYKHPLLLVFSMPDNTNQSEYQTLGFPEESFIQEIKGEYPNITIVLETGLQIPESLQYVLPLKPLLEDGMESKQCGDYEDVSYYVQHTIV